MLARLYNEFALHLRNLELPLATFSAFLAPFVLYALTLAPTVYNLDSAELTTAAATGGLVRSTGYPLYLLLGRLWTRLPIGDVGYRMNLFSAFNGALTIALMALIFKRLDVDPWASFAALGLLACSTYFWGLSLIAEVYTLHTALMSALILLLLRWAERPTAYRVAWVGLTLGMSLSHHAATVLLIPGCIWYLMTKRKGSPALRSWGLAGLALLVGLSLYLYLPICYAHNPTFNYAGYYDKNGLFHPMNLYAPSELWTLISGQAFVGQMFAYKVSEVWGELKRFIVQLWGAFLGVGIGPGLLGMFVLLRSDWQLGGMLLLMFLGNVGFYINYRVGDKVTMFLPAYLIWALWLGYGFQCLLQWVGEGRTGYLNVCLLRVIMAGMVLLSLGWHWQLVDLSNDWSARERGEEILRQVAPNALVLGRWDTVPVIEYLQLVEGRRPDIQAINRFMIAPDAMRYLIDQEMGRRPVYIDTVPRDLQRGVAYESVGPVYRLRPRK